MKLPTTKKNSTTNRPILLIGIITVILALATFAWFTYTQSKVNYAQQTAEPIETALVKAGATKACTRGDGGYGSDNKKPWYESYYTIAKNEEDTIAVVQQAAAKAGYRLNHATVEDKGPLPVADMYIDKWYYDYDEQASNEQLKAGNVQLSMTVNASGTDTVCSGRTLRIDSSHSVVGIEIRLPETK